MTTTPQWEPDGTRLAGKRVLVLAETPFQEGRAERPTTPVLEAEEAVASLVRAVLAEGGEVMLIGDEPLSLVAAMVAGEYAAPRLEETAEAPPRVTLYVQRSHNERADEETEDPFAHLNALGSANVRMAGQRRGLLADMASGIAAMVCVGTGSAEEVAFVRERTAAPVFVLAATGGGAAALARDAYLNGVEVADAMVAELAPLPEAREEDTSAVERDLPLPAVPLSAQWIVERLIDRSSDEVRRARV